MMLELAHDALRPPASSRSRPAIWPRWAGCSKRERPDLILLDVQMPEAYGDDVANVLRGLRNVTVPVLLFSILDERSSPSAPRRPRSTATSTKAPGCTEMVRRVKALLGEGHE